MATMALPVMVAIVVVITDGHHGTVHILSTSCVRIIPMAS
jgi:hypothetical protein